MEVALGFIAPIDPLLGMVAQWLQVADKAGAPLGDRNNVVEYYEEPNHSQFLLSAPTADAAVPIEGPKGFLLLCGVASTIP